MPAAPVIAGGEVDALRTAGVASLKSDSVRPPQERQEELTGAMAQQRRKRTQRERLIAGMVEVTNRRGYEGANVAAVAEAAGVSRPTFYEYFADREDCFGATIEDTQAELLARIENALCATEPERAWEAAVRALVEYAAGEPGRARFLMAEAMAGGSGALDARDRGVARIAAAIAERLAHAPPKALVADLEPRVVTGSVYRMLASRLRRGEAAIGGLAEELVGWVAAYERSANSRRWSALVAEGTPAPSPHVPDVPIQRMPGALPLGRPKVASEEIAENRRLRLLYAVAKLAESKGYTATTVADITKLARVDGRVFYRLFTDKREAFAAVHELGFQQVMDVTGKAFFSVEGWPQRSWEAGSALTQLLQANPLVANVGFVAAYAVGAGAVQRIEDSHTAFVFFLQEGLLYRPSERPASRVAMEAVIAGIFEVIYMQARRGEQAQIAAMFPYIAHIWLTPFLGVKESDAFIDRGIKGTVAKRPAGKS
jgi:AcrR family transcriptional regulator